MQKILEKNKLEEFLKELGKKYEVIVPVKEKNTKFKIFKPGEKIYLEKITEVPVKQFFMPENETLFEFKKRKIEKRGEKSNAKMRLKCIAYFG